MKKILFRSFATLLVTLGFAVPFRAAAQYTNGIFAEFNTSMGNFTCTLYYAQSPKAVANFIGLATGQRAWLELPSGLVKTNPFYNGITFHRVAVGFVNQSGSRTGSPTDGPGYAFVDQFTNALRHDAFGVLSMANSGKDSNGSQFFITVAPTSWLNDAYTIFGRLYGGSNVVYAINRVSTDANERPLTNVMLNTVTIRRVGAAANAFDILAQGLPVVTNLNLRIAKSAGNVSLTFSNRLYADTRVYATSNLTNWTSAKVGIDVSGTPTNSTTFSANLPRQFFRAAQILYPSSTFAPKFMSGRMISMTFTNAASGTLVTSFNSGGAFHNGTFTYNGSPGNVYSYNWLQDVYNGKFLPLAFYELDLDLVASLNFDNAGGGSFTGVIYPGPFYYDPNSPNSNPFAYSVGGSFLMGP